MTLNPQLSALLVFYRAVVLLLLTHTSADSVPCPAIEIIKGPNEVKLQCKSADNREAAVLWQDSVGNRIPSQESTNISSSVTVDKKQENLLTCKLQRDKITQTLRIFLQSDLFVCPFNSCAVASWASVLMAVLILAAIVGLGLRERKKRAATQTKQEEHCSLLAKMQQNKRFHKDLVNKVEKLQNELDFQRAELKAQFDDVETKRATNQTKPDEETTTAEQTQMIQSEDLERSKRSFEKQLRDIDKLVKLTNSISSLVSKEKDQVDIGGAEAESSV